MFGRNFRVFVILHPFPMQIISTKPGYFPPALGADLTFYPRGGRDWFWSTGLPQCFSFRHWGRDRAFERHPGDVAENRDFISLSHEMEIPMAEIARNVGYVDQLSLRQFKRWNQRIRFIDFINVPIFPFFKKVSSSIEFLFLPNSCKSG